MCALPDNLNLLAAVYVRCIGVAQDNDRQMLMVTVDSSMSTSSVLVYNKSCSSAPTLVLCALHDVAARFTGYQCLGCLLANHWIAAA